MHGSPSVRAAFASLQFLGSHQRVHCMCRAHSYLHLLSVASTFLHVTVKVSCSAASAWVDPEKAQMLLAND